MSEIDDIKYEVAVANRILAAMGLATGVLASLGHTSMRVPSDPDKFVVKGRGYALDALSEMKPEDMIVCDREGFKVDGPPGSTQCFEVKMHSCIYKSRPDVLSVTHVHPRFLVLMTTLRQRLRPMCQEGIEIVRNELPMYDHVKTIQSEAEGMDVANLLGNHRAVLLRGHGAATTGKSVEDSVMTMLQLEEQARFNYYAFSAMGEDHPYIEDPLIAEMTERPKLPELPHFAELMRESGAPRVGGVWQYYTKVVTKDL
ncbi:MAG: class II aldolase/adducin family protein [Chloroflexota bacterium]